jgi:hypothetical protein
MLTTKKSQLSHLPVICVFESGDCGYHTWTTLWSFTHEAHWIFVLVARGCTKRYYGLQIYIGWDYSSWHSRYIMPHGTLKPVCKYSIRYTYTRYHKKLRWFIEWLLHTNIRDPIFTVCFPKFKHMLWCSFFIPSRTRRGKWIAINISYMGLCGQSFNSHTYIWVVYDKLCS